ncbi:MAG: M61 family metallopeptidase, partial [Flavobacteriales bacterium]
MKKIILTGFVLFSGLSAISQTVEYMLTMPKPHTHYFEVEMKVTGWNKPVAEIKMPVWAPGSYLVREFAKNVDYFSATQNGTALKFLKTDKNTWTVTTQGAKEFTVKYNVYSNELSVRTSFIDDSHGFVSGTSVFMYVNGIRENAGTLKIVPHESFKNISTSLEKKEGTYTFPDYDILVDCPIEIGNHEIFYFEAAGVKHEVAMYGEGNYDVEELKSGMARIVEEATKVWGENPNKNYTFIVHNITNSSGGLEHLSSTTLQVNRHSYSGSGLTRFYSLVAHEYFHLWNVKRLRPKALGPFDYDRENYTSMLWFCEGFTSYYDELLLKRAGYYDESSYLRTLTSNFGSIENQPGALVQSAAESSHDAWIKGYRPNENSVNTTISYYPKGSAIAALLDIEIIAATKGTKKLDDLLKYM